MSPQRLKIGLAAFLILSSAVVLNMLLMQPSGARLDSAMLVRASDRTARAPEEEFSGQRVVVRPGTPNNPVVLNATAQHAGRQSGEVRPRDSESPFLATGSINSAELVRAVQRELRARGYEPGAEDGLAGPVTAASIMAFESDHRLPLRGVPTEKLLQTIVLGDSGQAQSSPRSPNVIESAQARDVVLRTQTAMRQLGAWNGPVDGQLSRGLLDAIRDFETRERLQITGRISGHLMARLIRLAG